MARIRVTIPVDPAWDAADKVVLLVGSENAGTLAASTPAGGTVAAVVEVAERADEVSPDPIVITAEVQVSDKCAMLPIGVAVEDEHGNRSTPLESFERVFDVPRGARDHAIAATENPNEALLTFAASLDV